jgi:DnaJ-class molecular chaperone
MSKQTYYEFFGLKNFESDPVILKKAYRSMALKYHPDRHKEPAAKAEAEEKMKTVNEVWRVLKGHREEYDRHLRRKSDHTADAFRYTKQNWTNTKGKKNPFKEWSFTMDEAEFVNPESFQDIYDRMMRGNWGTYYTKADPNKYDREKAEKKAKQRRQEEHDLEEQKKRFEFFARMTDDEYTEAKSWTEYKRNNGDVILGMAGEDLQPGELVIRGADGKFYKAKQKE